MNCLHSFRKQNKLKSYDKVCKYKYFCGIAMPSEKDNILEFNQYMKWDKMPYIIYNDIESVIKKIDGCANNSENSSTTNRWSYSLQIINAINFGIWSYRKQTHFRLQKELHLKTFCKSLREHTKNIIGFGNNVLPLTKEELKSYRDAKVCYSCGKKP